VGGAYCEVIVTTADDPLLPPTGAMATRDRDVRPVSDQVEPQPSSVAAYARAQQLKFVDASEALRAHDPSQPPLLLETAEDHDLYAALQAEYIVANVPGVWSTPTTGAPGALPAVSSPQPLSDAQ
jgi:hypothetical protein